MDIDIKKIVDEVAEKYIGEPMTVALGNIIHEEVAARVHELVSEKPIGVEYVGADPEKGVFNFKIVY